MRPRFDEGFFRMHAGYSLSLQVHADLLCDVSAFLNFFRRQRESMTEALYLILHEKVFVDCVNLLDFFSQKI